MKIQIEADYSSRRGWLSIWPAYVSGFIVLWLFGMEYFGADQSIKIRIAFFTISFIATLVFIANLEYRFYTLLDNLYGWRFLVVIAYSLTAVYLFINFPQPEVNWNSVMGVLAALPFFMALCFGSLIVTFIDSIVGLVLSRLHHRIIFTLVLMFLLLLVGGSMIGANLKDSDYLKGNNISIDFEEGSVLKKSEYFLNELSKRLRLKSEEIKKEQFLFSVFGMFVLFAIISACTKISHDILKNIYPLSDGFVKVGNGELDVRLKVRGSKEIKQLFSSFNQMVVELGMAKNMHSAFGKYVNRDLLKIIEDQRGNPNVEAVSKEATVFFADVRGFTSLSEKRSPADIMDFLNRFYSCIIPIIDSHEGYLNKFIGDEVMVVFNGPKDQPDHAARAAQCAVEIQRLLDYQNQQGSFQDINGLHIGIGLATGTVVAGNIGSQNQMEYTVIGDAVNLASRLTGQAGKGDIIVNKENAENNGMRHIELKPVQLKGKTERIVPYRIKYGSVA